MNWKNAQSFFFCPWGPLLLLISSKRVFLDLLLGGQEHWFCFFMIYHNQNFVLLFCLSYCISPVQFWSRLCDVIWPWLSATWCSMAWWRLVRAQVWCRLDVSQIVLLRPLTCCMPGIYFWNFMKWRYLRILCLNFFSTPDVMLCVGF